MGGIVAARKYHGAVQDVASGKKSVAEEVVDKAKDTQDAAIKQAKGAANAYKSTNKLVK